MPNPPSYPVQGQKSTKIVLYKTIIFAQTVVYYCRILILFIALRLISTRLVFTINLDLGSKHEKTHHCVFLQIYSSS